MANQFQTGYTTQDESRNTRGKIFPLVDIFEGGQNYISFGGEPFTFPNGLKYHTFQLQDNFTKFMSAHTLTFGAYSEKYQSNNIFMNCCTQSAYAYNSLADFYTDANGFLANPNRAVSPVTLRAFQISYSNAPLVLRVAGAVDHVQRLHGRGHARHVAVGDLERAQRTPGYGSGRVVEID